MSLISSFSKNIELNNCWSKWIIVVDNYLEKSSDMIGWTMNRRNVLERLEKIAENFEEDLKEKFENCIVTWEKHVEHDCNVPFITLYLKEAGHFYGYYSKRMAYKISGRNLPKMEIS